MSLIAPRFLAALPVVFIGAAAFAVSVSESACSCESVFLVPLSEEDYAKYEAASGGDEPALATCKTLCIRPGSAPAEDQDAGLGGGTAGSGGDGIAGSGGGGADAGTTPPPSGPQYSASYCHLVRGEKREPALFCRGTFTDCIGGRRPSGLLAGASPAIEGDRAEVARHFADLARLESASVVAFVELAAELAVHGAPDRLQKACFSAARDEVVHARIAGAIARAAGGAPRIAEVRARPIRSLDVLARDNVIEGVVLEGWGAKLASFQAKTSPSRLVRRAMGRIAIEEARHAKLARHIADWAGDKLGAAARRALRDEAERATEGLDAEWSARKPSPRLLGLPTSEQAHDRLKRGGAVFIA